MSTIATAVAQYFRLFASAERLSGKLEVAAGVARALQARAAGDRGALHVRRPVVIADGGIRWSVPAYDNSFASAAPGEENSPVVPEILRLLGTSSRRVCVDIGANLGYVCMTVAHRFPGKHVVAIEPIPWLAEALQQSARLNRFDNVTVIGRAMAPGPTLALRVPRLRGVWLTTLSSSEAGASAEAARVPLECVEVPASPLDAIVELADVDPADVAVVKIDVEGAEAAVLGTGARLLAGRPPVLFEALDGERRTQVEGTLRALGYGRFEPIDATNFRATA